MQQNLLKWCNIQTILLDEDRSICRWTGNEGFQYGISRFCRIYGRETVFSTLVGAGNYWKNNEKSGLVIIGNGISIFGHL